MSKKFSTLMAGLLLASAFSANAAEEPKVGDFIRLKNSTSKYVGIEIGANGLPTGALLNGNAFTNLAKDVDSDGTVTVDEVKTNLNEAQAQIWKIAKITTTETGLKSYQFTNKLTNQFLAIDLNTANNAGADAKIDATGNKDWYMDANKNLYIYKNSVDSTYILTTADEKLKLTRKKGTVAASTLAFTLDNAENPEVSVEKAVVWNGLMGAKGNDGKLHFNGDDVTSNYTNILKDTQWKALAEAGGNSFFLTDGKETSINKNPYMLMVDNKTYELTGNYFKLTTDTLAVGPKTDANAGNNVTDLKGGTEAVATYNGAHARNVETFARPIAAALWTAKYYLLNDSISLTPSALPSKNQYTAGDYIADGFKVITYNENGTDALNNAAIGVTNNSEGSAIKAHVPALSKLMTAVANWANATSGAGKANATFENGLQKTFAKSYFTAESGALAAAAYAEATDVYGADLVAAAKDALDATTADGANISEDNLKAAKKYVEAVTYLRRVKKGDTPEKYFERGVIHQTAETATTNYAVALVKALSERILTVANTTTDANASAPLIQPYVSAPTGDAEITASAGVFFMQAKNYNNKLNSLRAEITNYVVANTDGSYTYMSSVDEANPYAQWIFIQNAAGSYSIVNRGTNGAFYSGLVQKVKDEAGNVVDDTYVIGSDTLKLGAVTLSTDAVYEEKVGNDKVKYDYTGYFYAGPQDGKIMSFEISPVSPFMSSLALQVNDEKNAILGDAEDAPIWYFDQVAGTTYGANITGIPQLKSVGYKIYMEVDDAKKYLKKDGQKVSATADDAASATTFYFRTVAKDIYMIVDGDGVAAANKLTINPNLAQPNIEVTAFSNNMKNDYFTVGKATANKYRTLTAEDGVNGNAAIFLNNETSRYLYENSANIVANNGTKLAKDSLNFLGIFNAFELDKNPTVYVDTAYVEREGNIMPQYMFALGVDDVPATEGTACTEAGVHVDKDGNITTADKCVHATAATKGYKAGRYLVVLTDSTENKSAKYDGATRLAFVPAKHYLGEDSLVIDDSKWTGSKKVIEAGKATTYASKDTIKIENNKLKAMTFALLIKDQADQSFYLETVKDAAGKAQYVRILNGVPVLTNEKEDAAIFNIEASELEATANEAIAAEGAQVIGGKGAVTVQGAAGKVITVANILGQTIANQVAASDNVTIAVPAGIVVVAVEGDATKVVVK